MITATAGRPYGHVPGHSYLDAEIVARDGSAKLTITWGSAQGYDEEHGREEYTALGDTGAAISRVADMAIAEQERGSEICKYIRTAESRALDAYLADPAKSGER